VNNWSYPIVLSHDRDEKQGYEPPPVLLFLRKTGKPDWNRRRSRSSSRGLA
jgi:hypothetical protein